MRRQLALGTEFLARPYDAGAEYRFPRSVCGDARRERVGVIDQPACQREAVQRGTGGQRVKNDGHALCHRLGEREIIASQLSVRLAALPRIEFALDRHCCLLHVGDLLAQCVGIGCGVCRFGCRCFRHRGWRFDSRLHRRQLCLPQRALCFLFGAMNAQKRRLVLAICVLRVVHKREDLEILRVGDRVVFVRVALRACEARSHPDGQCRVRAIHHRGVAKLLVVCSALVVCHGVAVKGGRSELLVCWSREQVAGELLDGELIER